MQNLNCAPGSEVEWLQIIIPAPDHASGQELLDLLKLAQVFVSTKMVSVIGADWIGPLIVTTSSDSNRPDIAPTERFLQVLPGIEQIDWAHFFFTNSPEKAESILCNEPMTASIAKSDYTVSVCDNTYFYLYTRSVLFAEKVEANYANTCVKSGPLAQFDLP